MMTYPVVRLCKRWLSSLLPYRPMPGGKELLDQEYEDGSWDYLREFNELSRFSVVAGYCHHLKDGGSILEIGCGEGILQERLCPSRYSRYVGVDISSNAIGRAKYKQDRKNVFITEDASLFRPDQKFDIIIFNECLEYFSDPLSLLQRYEPSLEGNGVYIISMFSGVDTMRTKKIWAKVESIYLPEVQTQLTTRPDFTWIIRVYFPWRHRSKQLPR